MLSMLVCSPPLTAVSAIYYCHSCTKTDRDMGGYGVMRHIESTITSSSSTGLTLGGLAEAAAEMFSDHSSCRGGCVRFQAQIQLDQHDPITVERGRQIAKRCEQRRQEYEDHRSRQRNPDDEESGPGDEQWYSDDEEIDDGATRPWEDYEDEYYPYHQQDHSDDNEWVRDEDEVNVEDGRGRNEEGGKIEDGQERDQEEDDEEDDDEAQGDEEEDKGQEEEPSQYEEAKG